MRFGQRAEFCELLCFSVWDLLQSCKKEIKKIRKQLRNLDKTEACLVQMKVKRVLPWFYEASSIQEHLKTVPNIYKIDSRGLPVTVCQV